MAAERTSKDEVLYRIGILHRTLSSADFYRNLETAFFGRRVDHADIMLNHNEGFCSRKEVKDLAQTMKQHGDRITAVNFGARYNESHARWGFMEKKPVERVFCFDFDFKKPNPDCFMSQAFVVGMTCRIVMKQFMRGPISDNDVLICYTGGGWHAYFSSKNLLDTGTQLRRAIRQNVQRELLLNATRETGEYTRELDGHYSLARGYLIHDGSIISRNGRLLWDSRTDRCFVPEFMAAFMVNCKKREGEWLKPYGVVASILFRVMRSGVPDMLEEGLETIVNDINGGRLKIMKHVFFDIEKLQSKAQMKKSKSMWFQDDSLKSIIVYVCVTHDCLVTSMDIDDHLDHMDWMLRCVLSPKIKEDSSGNVIAPISYPVGNIKDAVHASYQDCSVHVGMLNDSPSLQDQPLLQKGLKKFNAWAKRAREVWRERESDPMSW